MGVAAVAAIALSAGLQAAGNYEQGQAARRQAQYQSQIANMNANIAKQNARYETELGQEKASQQQLKNRAVIGNIVASQGANGLDVNSGSDLNYSTGAREMGARDVNTITSNAERQAYNYEVAASEQTAQSQLYKSEASSENLSSYLSAGSSLLSGAGNAAYAAKYFGVFNGSSS